MEWNAIVGNNKSERIRLTRLTSTSLGTVGVECVDEEGDEVDSSDKNCLFMSDRESGNNRPVQILARLKCVQWLLIVSFAFNFIILAIFLIFYTHLRSSQESVAKDVGRIDSNLGHIKKEMMGKIGKEPDRHLSLAWMLENFKFQKVAPYTLQRGQGLSCDFWSAMEPLNTINVGCGGLVNIPANQASIFFHYKSISNQLPETSDHSHNCLWTMTSRGPGKSGIDGATHSLKVSVELLCDGFGSPKDLLTLIEWSVENGLSSHPLELETQDYMTEEYVDGLFLSFTSDVHSVGSDFIIRLDVIEVAEEVQDSFVDVRTAQAGNGTFGPYEEGHRFSLVVNPKGRMTTAMTVEYLDTPFSLAPQNLFSKCSHSDSLDIFEILEGGIPNLLDRLCGNVSSPFNYTTHYPILALFYTNASTSGRGFGLSWEALAS